VSATSDSNYLDPRAILGSVVKYTLEQNHSDLTEGRFPSEDFQGHFTSAGSHPATLPNHLRLELQDFPDADRRVGLLTIWGGCPTELVDLDPVIHTAFRIPPIGVGAPAEPRKPVPAANDQPAEGAGRKQKAEGSDGESLTPQVQGDLESIDGWIAGTNVLGDRLARQVRRHLADSLWEAIDWDTQLIKLDKDGRDRLLAQASFTIAEAAGGKAPSPGMWTTEVERTTKMGALVSGIVQFEALAHWAFPGGPAALQIRLDLLDSWTPTFVTHLRSMSGVSTPDEQRAAVLELAVSACILGAPGADSHNPIEVLSAALTSNERFSTQTIMARSDRLKQEALAGFDRRPEVLGPLKAYMGARQGGGTGVYALDTNNLLPAMKQFVTNPAEARPSNVIDSMSSEVELIRETLESIDELMGPLTKPSDLAKLIRAAAETSGELAIFYPGTELPSFVSQTRAAESFDMSIIDEARRRVAAYSEADVRSTLLWISQQPRASLADYLRFLRDAHRRLKESLDRANQRTSANLETPEAAALTNALSRIRSSLRGAE
jgi:hypothetical protein